MACDRCGNAWGRVINNKLICPKCGHSKDVYKTYEQLLSENTTLKERIKELEKITTLSV